MSAFEDYIALYLDEIAGLRYRDLAQMQPAPYASLARGAGGIVYMLWRRGDVRGARRWLAAAAADRRRAAYDYPGLAALKADPRRVAGIAPMYMYGRAGLTWLAALLGGAGAARAMATYARYAKSALATEDFMAGAAGYLTGARILLARTAHAGLQRAADRVARTLLDRARARVEDAWGRDATGFALRWPGALHALLAWDQHVGREPQRWLIEALRRLADAWTMDVVPKGFAATWCNGTPGMALLWTKAFEQTQDERFLDAARAMVQLALAGGERPSHLCCGFGGIAYALLALDRHDRDGRWRAEAQRVGAHAIEIALEVPLEWPNGLYLGHPGLVCLAGDLVSDHPLGFPAIDA